MRIITIRHDKSQNNALVEQSFQLYLEKRSNDPDICEGAKERCQKVGKYLKENNIKINKFYSSLHLRALKTMNYIAEEYNPEIPMEYFPYIFERGGIYLGEKGYPGLNQEKVNEMFPKVIIPEDVDITNGWYQCQHKETLEECKERTKKCIAKLKEMAEKHDDDYTICLISHENFLNGFYSFLSSFDFTADSISYGHDNLALSSFSIDKNKKINIDFINFSCLH